MKNEPSVSTRIKDFFWDNLPYLFLIGLALFGIMRYVALDYFSRARKLYNEMAQSGYSSLAVEYEGKNYTVGITAQPKLTIEYTEGKNTFQIIDEDADGSFYSSKIDIASVNGFPIKTDGSLDKKFENVYDKVINAAEKKLEAEKSKIHKDEGKRISDKVKSDTNYGLALKNMRVTKTKLLAKPFLRQKIPTQGRWET